MGRSFYKPSPENTVEDYSRNNTYYHKASDSYFTMLQRDGKYFQRRYQLDSGGKQINAMEKQIDYIMGSGNHSRAYLHRTERNELVELPLAWYSEKGGYWAMNPGYDRANHDGFRRPITYDCMFCHNAYPQVPAGNDHAFAEPIYAGPLPEGIDCQRCHGDGAKHMRLAKTEAKPAEVRNAIVNPARLSREREMEVCMQCHLETTSFPLPNSLQRYERGTFSYRPGEPLADFILNFDHAPGKGRDDKYEIVNSAYRLRRSACFLQSKGELRCTTCHNPHVEQAAERYNAVCAKCHAAAFQQLVATGKHTGEAGCTDCHMPKRRTEDVVHVVMTDHYIQRRKPAGDLLADMVERHETNTTAYRGEVVPYYPNPLPHSPADDLYLAIAQTIQGSNLDAGITQLTAAIQRYAPVRPEYYLDLAEAWREKGSLEKALPFYRQAVQRDPKFVYGLQKLGIALRRSAQSAQSAQSAEVLQNAAAQAPDDPATWRELGLTYQAQGKTQDAIAALLKAIELDPDMPEAHNNLGVIRSAQNPAKAEQDFREAIRIQPDYADAHSNLGNLLSSAGDFAQARNHFEISLRLRPDDAPTRYNYAMVLGRTRQFDRAQSELETALKIDANFVDAHLLLGDLLMAKGLVQNALPHYRDAVRIQPESGRALLSLGEALISAGDVTGALPHLRKAASNADLAVREEANQVLKRLSLGSH
jgi:tetratricopeptide (TPR) repeat protein